jgi:uncharacterized protein (DUF1501 family)
MDRRSFLKLAGVAPLTLMAPNVFAVPVLKSGPGGASGAHWDRILVLVELKGGNDGLNTVVPYRDKIYYEQRPKLAIESGRVLQLDEQLGLHPSLEGLMPIWQRGGLAVALGVGYPNPNRSHFRSIEIWETGSESNEYLQAGWLSRLFEREAPPESFAADGVVLGNGDIGPLSGGARALAMSDPQRFVRQAGNVKGEGSGASNPALAHLLEVREGLEHAVDKLRRQAQAAPTLKTSFPGNGFGRQMETAAKLLVGEAPVAVVKVSHGGFDTHGNQDGTHARLLQELGGGLAAFQKAMTEAGMWNRVLVMTYSEFGRRVKENGSRGTDHGTAAPHLVMGGRVKGGIYGQQPSLTELDGGDLRHTLDYRRLYATVAERWWELPAGSQGSTEYRPIECLG